MSTSTTLITTTDPVRIAEDYATLQHLSDGRVYLMMGRGNTGPVYPWFGKDIRDGIALAMENRFRLLTEAEAVLVTLPVAIRDTLPATSRVLPQLVTLADGHVASRRARPADRLKLERLATSLLDITTLTQRIKELDRQIPAIIAELGSTLTDLHGVGVVTAMNLLVEIGDPNRFTSEAQFARWCR